MKQITTHTGILKLVERMNSSVNGNPRYKLSINDVLFYTTPDSMHGYGIPNHFDRPITVTIGVHYGKNTLDKVL